MKYNRKENDKKYREKHKDEIKKRNELWRKTHRKEERERHRKYDEEHREERREYRRKWEQSEHRKKYLETHKDERKKLRKLWEKTEKGKKCLRKNTYNWLHTKNGKESRKKTYSKFHSSVKGKKAKKRYYQGKKWIQILPNIFPDEIAIDYHHIDGKIFVVPIPRKLHMSGGRNVKKHIESVNDWIEFYFNFNPVNLLKEDFLCEDVTIVEDGLKINEP
jgi:hypothetical protein